ncbi:MAG: hypothetical protein LUC99_00955 [Clostridiales bacterium]|nr:hypothetical protein [Clostridiales bacterium]
MLRKIKPFGEILKVEITDMPLYAIWEKDDTATVSDATLSDADENDDDPWLPDMDIF